jgi:hypothetical protein
MPFLPLLAGHHSNQNHYPATYAAPPGPAVAPPLLVPSQAPVSAPTVKSHFTSTLPPSYQQQYAYEEEDYYDRSEQQLHSGGYIENSLPFRRALHTHPPRRLSVEALLHDNIN